MLLLVQVVAKPAKGLNRPFECLTEMVNLPTSSVKLVAMLGEDFALVIAF